MTTIRGRIYHRTIDIRSVTDRDPILISAGWTCDILIDGEPYATRAGLPTWNVAWAACQDGLNLCREHLIHPTIENPPGWIFHKPRYFVNQRDQ